MSERLSKHGKQVAEYILDADAKLNDFGWEELFALANKGDLPYLMVINQLVWGLDEDSKGGEKEMVDAGVGGEIGGLSGVEIMEMFHKDLGM